MMMNRKIMLYAFSVVDPGVIKRCAKYTLGIAMYVCYWWAVPMQRFGLDDMLSQPVSHSLFSSLFLVFFLIRHHFSIFSGHSTC